MIQPDDPFDILVMLLISYIFWFDKMKLQVDEIKILCQKEKMTEQLFPNHFA